MSIDNRIWFDYYKAQYQKTGKHIFVKLARIELEAKREIDRVIHKIELCFSI